MVNPQSISPPSQEEDPPQPDDPVIKTTTPSGDGSNLNRRGNHRPSTTPPTDGSNPGVGTTISSQKDDGNILTNIYGKHPYMKQDSSLFTPAID